MDFRFFHHLGVEMAERMAYYGISGNLISYLTRILQQSTAVAASSINAWSGLGSLLTIVGAVIADSFVGKYYTVYILGLGLMTLSAMLPSLGCFKQDTVSEGTPGCSPHLQRILFFVALHMVAVGQGGHKPCVQAFGADQFDGEDPKERKAKSSFFNWWYFSVYLGGFVGIGA